uniref:Polyadenylate-binding protein-interacting protein 1 n=1 Tax=Hyalomma excavatum TaxID=257692 RepID=A0A131XPS1_9ACAR
MDSNGKAATPKKDSGVAPGASSAVTPKAGQASSTTDEQSMASFVMKSTLSPEAPVFVPRHFKVPAPEPYPMSPPPQDSTQYAILELMSFIEDVTLCPAEFDSKIGDLTRTLSSVGDTNGLVQVVDTIFQQGIKEPNFRYSGARLCNYLGSNLSVRGLDDGEFTNLLLDRCHAECLKRNDLASGDFGDGYLRGLLLFIAELFSQMVFIRDDYSFKVKHIAGCIPNMMHTLLQTPTKDNIKCTIQVLKLTGHSLEDFDNLEPSSTDGSILDSVFDRLREILQKPDVDPTASLMIKNVLDLREKNWGRSSSSSSSPSGCPSEENLPITCGPDGVPLSREEENFVQELLLEEQMGGLEIADGTNVYPNDCSDEMDDEVAAAYEEFLKESGR